MRRIQFSSPAQCSALHALHLIMMFVLFSLCTQVLQAQNFTDEYLERHKASLLADVESGRILYAHRIDENIYPASLVKMMVALITMENLKEGRISLRDPVRVSSWASRIGGRQVYLKQGEVFPLSEMMKAMVITSANDVTVAIAEHQMGSVEIFIEKMNLRARELGMKHTRFHSVHGLPPGRRQQYDRSTGRDLLTLARELLKHPQYLEWSSIRLDSFRQGTFQLLNTNHILIRKYKGMDGMKTGYHRRSGFNLVATAKRGQRRFVSIVLGARNSRWRRKITRSLRDHGFEHYLRVSLDVTIDTSPLSVEVELGREPNLRLRPKHPLVILLSEKERLRVVNRFYLLDRIEAPVEQGTKVGEMEYRLDGQPLGFVPLVAENGVEKAGMLSLLANAIFN